MSPIRLGLEKMALEALGCHLQRGVHRNSSGFGLARRFCLSRNVHVSYGSCLDCMGMHGKDFPSKLLFLAINRKRGIQFHNSSQLGTIYSWSVRRFIVLSCAHWLFIRDVFFPVWFIIHGMVESGFFGWTELLTSVALTWMSAVWT